VEICPRGGRGGGDIPQRTKYNCWPFFFKKTGYRHFVGCARPLWSWDCRSVGVKAYLCSGSRSPARHLWRTGDTNSSVDVENRSKPDSERTAVSPSNVQLLLPTARAVQRFLRLFRSRVILCDIPEKTIAVGNVLSHVYTGSLCCT
jgi:hypothetical protein